MDTLLSQLVCSVVALLVYKYVETGQEAPGSYTWPHRSSPKILMIKGGFKKVSFQTSVILQMISCCCFFPCSLSWLFSSQLELCPIQVEGNARARDTSVCFFHFVRIKIFLSVCSYQRKVNFKGGTTKARITSNEKEKHLCLICFLIRRKKKSIKVPLCLWREAKEGLWNITLAVPISFGFFEVSSAYFEPYFKQHFVPQLCLQKSWRDVD